MAKVSIRLGLVAIFFRLCYTCIMQGYLPVDISGDGLYQAADLLGLILSYYVLQAFKTVTGTRLSFTASAPAAAQETLRRREARAGRIDAPRVTCWAPFAARWPRNEAGVTPP